MDSNIAIKKKDANAYYFIYIIVIIKIHLLLKLSKILTPIVNIKNTNKYNKNK